MVARQVPVVELVYPLDQMGTETGMGTAAVEMRGRRKYW